MYVRRAAGLQPGILGSVRGCLHPLKHLGAVVGTESFRAEYVSQKIEKLSEEVRILVEIAKLEPQAAYSAFFSGFRHKLM